MFIPEIKQRKKLNLVCHCGSCGQDYIYIVINERTGRLYCQCLDCGILFDSPSEAVDLYYLIKKEPYSDNYTEAPLDKIINLGWDMPKNKVCLCHQCMIYYYKSKLNKAGWVTIKKNNESGKLFCRCERCGSIWKNIEDALYIRAPEYTQSELPAAESIKQRFKAPDNVEIPFFEEVSDGDIEKAGWDKYKDILLIFGH